MKKRLVAVFFILLFIGGVITAGDYGVSWDEKTETQILVSNVQYAAETLLPKSVVEARLDPVLQTFYKEKVLDRQKLIPDNVERDHGQALYYPAAAVFFAVYALKQADPSLNIERALYHGRHIYNFIVCYFALLCLYALVKKLTGRRRYGLLCVGMALLTPRFFADFFYNNKDMIAFAAGIFMMYAVYRFFEKQTFPSAVWAGVVGAFAVNTRVSLALFLPLAAIYYLIKNPGWKSLARLLVLAVSSLASYYVITPAAWEAPLSLLKYVLNNAIYFSRWDGYIYYFGDVYHPSVQRLPWHYLPVMIGITTPLLILALVGFGLIRLRKIKETNAGFIALAAVFSFLSLLVPMLLRSNVYNGWRHLYYIYSGFLLLAVWGVKSLLESPRRYVKITAIACIAVQVAVTGFFMVRNHPYEYTYYNVLAGAHPEENFELDYWNTAQSRLIKKALEENPDKQICVFYSTAYCANIDYADILLTDDQRARLHLYTTDPKVTPAPIDFPNSLCYLVINPTTAKKMVLWGNPLYLDEDQTQYFDLEPAVEITVGNSAIQQMYPLSQAQAEYLMW
jgi:hypothetical protein